MAVTSPTAGGIAEVDELDEAEAGAVVLAGGTAEGAGGGVAVDAVVTDAVPQAAIPSTSRTPEVVRRSWENMRMAVAA